CVRQNGQVRYWRRPGKDGSGWSATTGVCTSTDKGHELFCVFSTSAAPFAGPANGRPCSAHTKFTAYTILNHGGDFKLAARALAKAGFGDRRPSAQGNVQVGEETAPTGYAIILAHFQKKHGPAFRREGVIMSGPEKRPIKQGEACAGAGIELIEELARASD